MRKGQISIEIMYAVGVMIIIFILLTGISFNRRYELIKLDDFLNKKNECLRISDSVTGIQASGNSTISIVNIKYYTDAYSTGVILVKDAQTTTPTSVEASCTFHGNLSNPLQTVNMKGQYRIKNREGSIFFEKV